MEDWEFLPCWDNKCSIVKRDICCLYQGKEFICSSWACDRLRLCRFCLHLSGADPYRFHHFTEIRRLDTLEWLRNPTYPKSAPACSVPYFNTMRWYVIYSMASSETNSLYLKKIPEIPMPVCLSVCLFVCMFIYLSVCPSVCLSVCLSAWLPVSLLTPTASRKPSFSMTR